MDLVKLIWEFVETREENFYQAICSGYLSQAKWFQKNFNITQEEVKKYENCNVRMAAKGGHLETLKWLHETFGLLAGFQCSSFRWAAIFGHLHVLKWLHQRFSIPCTDDTIRHIAYEGNIKILDWVFEIYNLGIEKLEFVQDAEETLAWCFVNNSPEGKKRKEKIKKLQFWIAGRIFKDKNFSIKSTTECL